MPRASNLLLLQELLCEPVTVSHLSLLAADRLSLLCRTFFDWFFSGEALTSGFTPSRSKA